MFLHHVLVFCLYSHETDTYVRMIAALKEYITKTLKRHWNPCTCMCDFEKGFFKALETLEIDMRGCKFHLLQAVKRKLIRYGIDSDAQKNVLISLKDCFHAVTEEEFQASLEKLYVNANSVQFQTYFDGTWVGNDYKLASRWAAAYQRKFQSFDPDRKQAIRDYEQVVLDEIISTNTNNLSEGRNNADRILFQGKNGRKCSLFEQVCTLHSHSSIGMKFYSEAKTSRQ
jgi:isocitrate dehydrogenase